MLTIHLLPALYGDTILIDIGQTQNSTNKNILIDCGFSYRDRLLPLLRDYKTSGKIIDRFIITHYDDDHIRNASKFLEENGLASSPNIIEVSQVWLNAFRHLQFQKVELQKADKKELEVLKNFITTNNPDIDPEGGEIGARQASLLGKQILAGKYSWNEDFNGKAACIENNPKVNISDNISIELLGPDKLQLEVLEDEFKSALNDFGIEYSENELVDDAFELYSRYSSCQILQDQSGEISGDSIVPVTAELIRYIADHHVYNRDRAPGNGSSISFILNANGKKILMLADAHAEPIMERLKELHPGKQQIYFDAVKISHHGSANNNPKELFDLIDSPLYFISTNGKHPSHVHPDIQTVSFIVNRPIRCFKGKRRLIFNYYPQHLSGLFEEDLQVEFNYTAEVSTKIELP
ncbi:MBL fold metallo-hydrolase [Flavobacterium beibuense]|uniref:Zn-dependent hydrolase n=1 Tax=Flavobacterium beibuense TaxID=657326 RepID=A0A444WEM3_9FLAO|nr:MBL fold metallo-hydrolase [Flavobacterium beibuense]RYJ44277.1 Zn-dependent hydrolase [Flavobacterium beibuense]